MSQLENTSSPSDPHVKDRNGFHMTLGLLLTAAAAMLLFASLAIGFDLSFLGELSQIKGITTLSNTEQIGYTAGLGSAALISTIAAGKSFGQVNKHTVRETLKEVKEIKEQVQEQSKDKEHGSAWRDKAASEERTGMARAIGGDDNPD